MNLCLDALRPMRGLVALGVVLATAGSGCSEDPVPKTAPTPVDKVMEENQKASEAVVHAAKEVAKKAGDHAEQIADAAKEAAEAVAAMARGTLGNGKEAMKGK